MKKLLTSLMGISLITSTTISVVACGSKDPDKTLKLGYNTILANWNTAKTMNQEDHYILSNTNATPLGSDQYGRQYGDLFELTNENYGATSPYIGKTIETGESKFTEWTYKLRDNATWSNYKGVKDSSVSVNDFINTAKYVLNVGNASNLTSLWTSFIKGASQIVDVQNPEGENKSFDEAWDAHNKDLGIVANETNKTVTFKLAKPSDYFETLLTYSVFSPIHSKTVDNPQTNQDFKKSYFSGPFTPTKFKNEQDLVLDKNDNYHLKDDTKLNRLRFKWAVGGPDKARTLFESGAIDQFKPVVSDGTGWDKYIGTEPSTPIESEGLSWTEESPDDATSFVWMFNIVNSNYHKAGESDSEKERTVAAGRALQNKDVRKFISTHLNRSTYISYSSNKFDKNQPISEIGSKVKVSSMLRNAYTPNYKIDTSEKEYWDHLTTAINRVVTPATEITKDDIKDGKDFLFGQRKDLWKSVDTLAEVNKYLESDSKIKTYLDKNGGKLKIYLPIHPATKNTSGTAQQLMMQEFNEINGNKIEIHDLNVRDQNQFNEVMTGGTFDILNLGWTWDFEDAYSYLHTFKIGADLSPYVGTTRMFSQLNASNFKDSKFDNFNKDFVGAGDGKEKMRTDFIVDKVTEQFYDELLSYSRTVDLIDETKTGEERLKLFAEQEAKLMYDSFRFMPLNKRALPIDFTVSYAKPFSLSITAYGLSRFKYWAIETDSSLMSAKDIAELKVTYEKNKKEVEADPKKHQDTTAWKK